MKKRMGIVERGGGTDGRLMLTFKLRVTEQASDSDYRTTNILSANGQISALSFR